MVKWPRGATAFGARGQHAVDFPDGSEARHISTAQYYKELIEQQGSLQENIGNLLQLEEEAQKKLKQVKGEINTQKMKSAAVNAKIFIMPLFSSSFLFHPTSTSLHAIIL